MRSSARSIDGAHTTREANRGAPATDDATRLSTLLAAHIREHGARHRSAPISSDARPEQIRRHLAHTFDFLRPVEVDHVFTETTRMLWQWAEHATNPMHFGLTRPTVDVISVIADALVALYDPNLAMWEFSPAALEIENHVLRFIGAHLGMDTDSGFANFTSGGQEANHTAVAVALTAKWPAVGDGGLRRLDGQPTFYLSAEAHHSFDKVAHCTGLGRDAMRVVPVRDDLTCDVAALRTMLDEDRAGDALPFLVVATAGTTGSGIIDPLGPLGALAREYGLWYHVDAAWGGAAALSPRLRHHLSGIQLADSVTLDAHKWLSVPVGAGMFFTRHRKPVDRTFSTNAAYVPDLVQDGRVYPMYTTMQWSRRCMGLKLFMMLARHGRDGIAARIEHQVTMGAALGSRLREAGWVVVNDTPLPVLCFTHPALESGQLTHDEVVRRLKEDQTAWISKVRLANGITALRASITNYNTTEADVARLVDALNGAVNGARR